MTAARRWIFLRQVLDTACSSLMRNNCLPRNLLAHCRERTRILVPALWRGNALFRGAVSPPCLLRIRITGLYVQCLAYIGTTFSHAAYSLVYYTIV
ncbi:hypothetical protein T310_9179 [Rasamsonia emersonii CBS 393.64]|uniref:Uncharacterized protein n=1 Tax=Rasamsonia emersonii (strain ATCC 16479 / CBS 393.64 / IMI 116815) TaxID=1408163 RepID=A0A0F4YG08_RASE3|nr:hypothetical protein T310_9179 [Rasamsonia emersonii CBS 393.64]KKA17167.1 hypothetical protein T310_9179 [Rasamsonia emersonii CBS 393.64]